MFQDKSTMNFESNQFKIFHRKLRYPNEYSNIVFIDQNSSLWFQSRYTNFYTYVQIDMIKWEFNPLTIARPELNQRYLECFTNGVSYQI